MALNADYDVGLGKMPLHFSIRDYRANLRTGWVTGRLEIYSTADRRQARKVAAAALKSIIPQLDAAMVARHTANEAYKAGLETARAGLAGMQADFEAQPEEAREAGQATHAAAVAAAESEMDAAREAHEAKMLEAHQQIEALKTQRTEQEAIFNANAPFKDGIGFEIPPGGVEIGEDGSVGLPAIYAWLAEKELKGGVQA